MKLRRFIPLLPFVLFGLLLGILGYRLQLIEKGSDPSVIPSVMIGRQAPDFNLPSLMDGAPNVSAMSLKGEVVLINVFASWCVACHAEHPFLKRLRETGVMLVGVDYKDAPEAAKAWLEKNGNPYDKIGSDRDGRVGIDFGVYGVPESYLLDRNGVIRFKQTGPLTPEDIEGKLVPMIEALQR